MTNDEKTSLANYLLEQFNAATLNLFLQEHVWPVYKARARDPISPYYVDARTGEQVTEKFVKSGAVVRNKSSGRTWRFEKSLKRLISATIE